VPTKRAGHRHILYVVSSGQEKEDIALLKLGIDPGAPKESSRACVLEVLKPFTEGRPTKVSVLSLLPWTEAAIGGPALFMASESAVTRLPAQRCRRYSTEALCIASGKSLNIYLNLLKLATNYFRKYLEIYQC